MTTTRPYRITDTTTGRTVATTTTLHKAECAVARRIASDVEGTILTITGPEGVIVCKNDGLTISYEAA